MTLRTFSFGCGRQSMAALILAARGEIDFPTFLFCNVGDDSENPATLDYFFEYAGPYAERHGIGMLELRRGGKYRSLLDRLVNGSKRTIDIPVRMAGAGAPTRRTCTGDFKIAVVANGSRHLPG